MLGKLIKYEWRGLRLPLTIMMIVLAGTMILTCGVILTINPKLDETLAWYSGVALTLSFLLYYFGIIGCTLGTTLIVVVRFYKTCYTDQGDPHAACDDAPALKQQTYCRHRDTAFDAACHRMQYFHHRAGWHSPYIFFYTRLYLR